ncbi:MAG: hypothetical protein COZ75_10610 [Flavobacteriaceae bacterium CG_4_8_14_3_um_filter_34_10]|nr:hypothetical protein [Flavobacteriia bacterium]OIP50927.1 MAG: hypothetical protein AUK33_06035 [Flavobacteriaceae bacterium CG2_30_34_30]PIQ18142.1 MAG: hypothetical protein COW66_07985 [Flavobacteriaceae bacterium CG18_big_fil_WC_8_21_14_2_50_34_36]PIV48939.1 MAG: hypothetical protein COS19_11235 [Flavobacteriaceae bacterium CG02_land_8_20_14_3_00_34_13]PIX08705.1 MAG: hypothetical protein COZ75_10610 [Flavobacteriaceae bacterium CG_4_8_14_3_um_filter_34_10]PIZ08299.1 MAG: hypothetical pr
MLSYKTKQYLVATLKVSVVIASYLFIYFRIVTNDALTFEVFQTTIEESSLFKIQNIIVLVLLTCLNWGFEILKWKTLAAVVSKIRVNQSAKHVLTAQAVSLCTPFKIGEYGTKTLFFLKKQAKKVVFLNFLGNMSQLAATLFFGSIGLGVYISNQFPEFTLAYFVLFLLTMLSVVLSYPFWKKMNFLMGNFTLRNIQNFSATISKKIKQKVLGFAFLRYMVFSLQFCFIMNCLIPISIVEVLPFVFLMYLISSAIPLLQFFDVVIKGSVAILVFSDFNDLIVLSVTTLMWLFNAVLPAIIGSYFVLTFNEKPLLNPEKL